MKLPKPQLEQPYSDRWLVASILLCNLQKHRALGKEGLNSHPQRVYKKPSVVVSVYLSSRYWRGGNRSSFEARWSS
jgi:hypothetical protein